MTEIIADVETAQEITRRAGPNAHLTRTVNGGWVIYAKDGPNGPSYQAGTIEPDGSLHWLADIKPVGGQPKALLKQKQAEVKDLRELIDWLLEEILRDACESCWDGEEAATQIAVNYVRHLETGDGPHKLGCTLAGVTEAGCGEPPA